MRIKQLQEAGFKVTASHAYETRKKIDIIFGLFTKEPKTVFSNTDILVLNALSEETLKLKNNGSIFVIDSPGEYEVHSIFIQGVRWTDENKGHKILYVLEAEKMRICCFDTLPQQELSPQCLERIGDVDVLIVPIGQQKKVLLKEARNVISQIDPSLVIFLKQKVDKSMVKETDDFLKTIGAELSEEKDRVSFEKRDLSDDGRKFIIIGS